MRGELWGTGEGEGEGSVVIGDAGGCWVTTLGGAVFGVVGDTGNESAPSASCKSILMSGTGLFVFLFFFYNLSIHILLLCCHSVS